MFPAISPQPRFASSVFFSVRMDSIEDLFYDGKDPETEILKLQTVVDANTGRLQTLYNCGGPKGMDRKSFQKLAVRLVGNEVNTAADEIFSCVTNLYGDDNDDQDNTQSNDVALSTSQFVGAIVRLANLKSLMYEGMVDTSELAAQTEKFLRE